MAGPIAGLSAPVPQNSTTQVRPAIASEDQLRNQQTANQTVVSENQELSRSQEAPVSGTQEANADLQQDLTQVDVETFVAANSDSPRGSLLDIEA